jgi:hypothetical protein
VIELRGLTAQEKYCYYNLERSGESSATPVRREGYGIFQVTAIQTKGGVQTDRAVEKDTIQETPLSPEVHPISSQVIGQHR